MIPQNHLFFPSVEVGWMERQSLNTQSVNLHLLLTFMWCLELSEGQNIVSLK